MQARYIVGCDGGTSLVRKLLNMGFESLDFDEPWLVVDVIVDDNKLHKFPDTFVQYCDPARPTTYVVGPGNHRRWEFMVLPGQVADDMNREEAIWGLLSRWLEPEDGRLWRAAPYVFHALIAEEWRRERVFLAGDAAHMTPPFMAQGMCQGIRDAANLAWKLELFLAGKSGAARTSAPPPRPPRHLGGSSASWTRRGHKPAMHGCWLRTAVRRLHAIAKTSFLRLARGLSGTSRAPRRGRASPSRGFKPRMAFACWTISRERDFASCFRRRPPKRTSPGSS
jgi:2-polyprenyl-6-methoxyphenol hydroxylase-like FAD-dependent oxidoreductase